jgi:hypothetical protein
VNRRTFFGLLAASPLAMLPAATEATLREDGFIEDGEFSPYCRKGENGRTYCYPTYTGMAELYERELARSWELEKENRALRWPRLWNA